MNHSTLRWIFGAALAAVLVLSGAWLYGQTRSVTGTFGPTAANPAYIIVNTPTPVSFTAKITDPQLKKRSVILLRVDASGKPTDILGRMKDDGLAGDAKANDAIYTLQKTLNEPTVGSIAFRVGARFKSGIWKEPEPDDDNWDALFASRPTDAAAKRAWILKVLLLLGRYQLSNVFDVTVDPFPLPPDPGEAGKQTLQGIDSDHDGVRDDVQRWIGLTYLDSPRTRKALLQLAAAEQAEVLAPDGTLGAAAQRVTDSTDCLLYVVGVDALQHVSPELRTHILNTKERSLRHDAIQTRLSGSFFVAGPLSALRSKCQFDPDR